MAAKEAQRHGRLAGWQGSLPRAWNDPRFGIARKGVPVVGITWYEVSAYCRWLGRRWAELDEGRTNPGWRPKELRLPTEAEWVLAVGGDQPKERYPWDEPGQATDDLQEVLLPANVREADIGRTTPAACTHWVPASLMGCGTWAATYGNGRRITPIKIMMSWRCVVGRGAMLVATPGCPCAQQASPEPRMVHPRFSGVGPPMSSGQLSGFSELAISNRVSAIRFRRVVIRLSYGDVFDR